MGENQKEKYISGDEEKSRTRLKRMRKHIKDKFDKYRFEKNK